MHWQRIVGTDRMRVSQCSNGVITLDLKSSQRGEENGGVGG